MVQFIIGVAQEILFTTNTPIMRLENDWEKLGHVMCNATYTSTACLPNTLNNFGLNSHMKTNFYIKFTGNYNYNF